MRSGKKIGVILMTYGSPKTLDDIPDYLRRIYHGKDPSHEVLAEFRRRYDLIGGSPLIEITQAQANALEKELTLQVPEYSFQATAGMRFSPPFISEVIPDLVKDAEQIVGIIMSPQYSPIIMRGYEKELHEAISSSDNPNVQVTVVHNWCDQPLFLDALAQKVCEQLEKFPIKKRLEIPVLFTAHSMPKRVVEKEKDYIQSLHDTAKEVAKRLKLSSDQWMFCYQSAGHTPEEWLKPDFADIMPELKKQGKKYVLIAPVQFLADHLETLYDIDIGAREQAEEYGITFLKTESLNTSPLFIKALAAVVTESV